MNKKLFRLGALILALVTLASVFSACGKKEKVIRVTDVVSTANKVTINGKEQKTVEARQGGFIGKQGDYIEFKFPEPQTFNTIFIAEKTANVRQFNIFAEIDGKFKLIYTGQNILNQDIIIEKVTATGLKFQVVNTEIGKDEYIIQGIGAYDIPDNNLALTTSVFPQS